MKICFKCNIEKPLSEFYVHKMMADGHLNKCKSCTKSDTENRRVEKESSDLGWVLAERARHRAKAIKYRERGLAAPQKQETKDAWAARNPEKKKANTMVSNAIRDGKLQRQPCFCGKKAQAHHEDYSKPLEVMWLCTEHHAERHVFLRDQELKAKFNNQ